MRVAPSDHQWSVSSYCAGNNCVQVAAVEGGDIALRDSKAPEAIQYYSPEEWRAFLEGVRKGDFA